MVFCHTEEALLRPTTLPYADTHPTHDRKDTDICIVIYVVVFWWVGGYRELHGWLVACADACWGLRARRYNSGGGDI